jgi:regulatory protein
VREKSPASCREAALRMLATSERTRRELEDALLRKGFPDGEVVLLLGALEAERRLDDRRAAAEHVRTREVKGMGRDRILAELLLRGVSAEVASVALPEAAAEDARLVAALERKARTLPPGLTLPERSRRLLGHLVRRGFSSEAAARALCEKGWPVDDDSP